jgi:hypothetical protein
MWSRLLAMSPHEIATRTAMGSRRGLDLAAWQVREPEWRRSELSRILDTSLPALDLAARLVSEGEATLAHGVLSNHFATRQPRFLLVPRAREAFSRLIRARFPDAVADARRRADQALDGRLDVLGYRSVSFADSRGEIDWHRDPVHNRCASLEHWSRVPYLAPSVGDHKVIWELNRHQHWLALGRAYWLTWDPRYRAGFVRQLDSWMRANPPRTGINWASMLEIGFRCQSWIWALHFFAEGDHADPPRSPAAGEPPWTVDLLIGLHAQLALVERHLSTYFSPNTHLAGEALALYVAGRALPELRAAARWAATGRRVLISECARQIHADGGHAELSTYYHRYMLDFYLLALAVARATEDASATSAFEDAVSRLAGYAHTLSDRQFHLPQLGDDDGGQLVPLCGLDGFDVGPALAIASALLGQPNLSDGRPREIVLWFTGELTTPRHVPDRRTSACLPDSGYVVSRTWRGDHLVMDVGPHGYLNGGHAHADALSITLSVAGRPLFIDPGTGCYTVDPVLRDRFRETAAHNTVVVDGRSQSQPEGAFHWRTRAACTLDVSQLTPRFDYIEGRHDGYGPDGHCRQVMARPGCWIIVDWVGGPGPRHAAAHWHLDPGWKVESVEGARVLLRHGSGHRLWMLTTGPGFESYTGEPNGWGWHAPAYGAIRPTTLLRTAVIGPPPFALATIVMESDALPALDTIGAAGDGARHPVLAFQLTGTGWRETVTASHPSLGNRDRRALGIPEGARFSCERVDLEAPDAPAESWVAGTRFARDRRPPAVDVLAAEPNQTSALRSWGH